MGWGCRGVSHQPSPRGAVAGIGHEGGGHEGGGHEGGGHEGGGHEGGGHEGAPYIPPGAQLIPAPPSRGL